ncbi:MAG: hypothetical protein L6416_03545 [Candidatus Omnitrophica bacterium]|nr:hypothetical protein [Candidatus Omnitrophota bacterium]
MSNKRGQALLFAFLLLMLLGILTAAVASLWQSEIKIRDEDKLATFAFYLAQAGVERAKIEVIYNVALSGSYGWYNDLDIAGDNYIFRYNFSAAIISPTERALVGTGEVLDLSGNILAHKEISVIVDGIADTVVPFDGIDDVPADNQMAQWTWQVI